MPATTALSPFVAPALPATAFVRAPGSPGRIAHVGVSVHVLVRAGDTGGAWSLVDYELPPRFAGPPPHVHAGITEAFYCTEGTLALMLDGQAVTLRAGEVAVVPPGVPHAFANPSDTPARMLLWLTPGGFERYFDDLAALAAASPVWPPADPGAMAAVAARYDLVPAAAVRQAAAQQPQAAR
jgi:quercetin dioxygenase-like cupin family protein